jgi:hypothetical protein
LAAFCQESTTKHLPFVPKSTIYQFMVASIEPNPPPAKHPSLRRVTADIVELMVDLIERFKLTEGEACQRVGLKEGTWFSWKSRNRNTEKYARLCSRVRGAAIYKCLERIEKAGEDLILEGPDGKPIIRRGDWRADHARLQLIARDRFGDQQSQTNNTQVIISESAARAALDRIMKRLELERGAKPAEQLRETNEETPKLLQINKE